MLCLLRRVPSSVRPNAFTRLQCARGISSAFDAQPRELSASGQSSRVIFGAKVAATQLGSLSRSSGMLKVLLVRDRDAASASRTQYAEFLLMQTGVPCFQYTLERDCATLDGVDHAVSTAQRVGANGIVAFGGGNTMDLARAVAVVLANGGKAADFVAVADEEDEVGELKLQQEGLETTPLLLVPTIASSGAEVANNVVLLDEEGESKLLFAKGCSIVPEAVLIDPTLMLTVPLQATVQGALTALGQCLESYLLGCADDATNALALEGLEAVAGALAVPLKEKLNLKGATLREQFALGSLLSGIAANSSGTGAAQALAVSMGGISDLPHSQVATAFLPYVFDRYAELASENEGDPFFDELREKLESAADRLTAASGFQGANVAAWLRYVIARFDLPTASSLELEESLLNGLADRAAQYQDETMQVARSDDSGAIMEKDDLRAIIDNAVLVADPSKQSEDK